MKALNNFSEGFLLIRRRLQVLPQEYRIINTKPWVRNERLKFRHILLP